MSKAKTLSLVKASGLEPMSHLEERAKDARYILHMHSYPHVLTNFLRVRFVIFYL